MPPKTQTQSPRGGYNFTIGVGLVNVDVKLAPLTRNENVRGRTLCKEHLAPIKQASRCTADDHLCEETVIGYEYGGGFVLVDASALAVQGDKRVELDCVVDVSTIDPLYFEKSYLLWPQAGHEAGFDLLAKTFRDNGKAAVGRVVLSKSTRALVIRWSDATGGLVAHVCTYDANIRWADVGLVHEALEARPEPDAKQVAAAATLLQALEGEFDSSELEDDYQAALCSAIEAAAAGKPIEKREEPAPAPAVDLMAALQASVEQVGKAKAKSNGKAKPRKKVAA